MAVMKQYVYDHCPAIAAVGPFIANPSFLILNRIVLGPTEQLREYNRTRSRMSTISH